MALDVGAYAHVDGLHATAPNTQDGALHNELLKLQDAVMHSRHSKIRLAGSVIDQLRSSLAAAGHPENADQQVVRQGASVVGRARSEYSTNLQQHSANVAKTAQNIPGIFPSSSSTYEASQLLGAKPSFSAGLDPIFLQKSENLVRAEGQLKRQRIERDLYEQAEKRRHTSFREKDAQFEGISQIDVDAVLAQAFVAVPPVSGLKAPAQAASEASSFDENDYYSSQVESEWSGDAPSKSSDRAAAAFTTDFERLDNGAPAATASAVKRQPLVEHPNDADAPAQSYGTKPDDAFTIEDDEEDEYVPAEPIDGYHENGTDIGQITAPEDDADSEYEPGDVTQESADATPQGGLQYRNKASPQVPIIRNHLTHIAAPQPNRVSPLAVQKGPSIELELVNGRPEVVHKPTTRSRVVFSRPSSASPSGPGAGQNGKKRKSKKRKRDQDANGRYKRRKDRQAGQDSLSHPQREPLVKDEPISPPPFAFAEPTSFGSRRVDGIPAHVDLVSPRRVSGQQGLYEAIPGQFAPMSYENQPPLSSPSIIRIGSAAGHGPTQRDNQDLRRVASLHYAQRPVSPGYRPYSPVGPYRAAATASKETQYYAAPPEMQESPYRVQHEAVPTRYVRTERSPSPVTLREYNPMDRIESPAFMHQSAPAPRRVVVDQYGNRYYTAEPAPAPAPVSYRASVAPNARRPESVVNHDRAPTRLSMAYATSQAAPYDPTDPRMLPPAPRQQITQVYPTEYIDSRGYRVREVSSRPLESVRYSVAPTSPVYQPQVQYEQGPPASSSEYGKVRRFEDMPPPPSIAAEARQESRQHQMAPPPLPGHTQQQGKPMYAPARAYSVRPDYVQPSPISYARQGSVAPVQYVMPETPQQPMRAVSVMPAHEFGGHMQDPRSYGYVQQAGPRYVDDRGQEMQTRQARY